MEGSIPSKSWSYRILREKQKVKHGYLRSLKKLLRLATYGVL